MLQKAGDGDTIRRIEMTWHCFFVGLQKLIKPSGSLEGNKLMLLHQHIQDVDLRLDLLN